MDLKKFATFFLLSFVVFGNENEIERVQAPQQAPHQAPHQAPGPGQAPTNCASCNQPRPLDQMTSEERELETRQRVSYQLKKILERLRLQEPPNVTVYSKDLPAPIIKRAIADATTIPDFDSEDDGEEDELSKTRGVYLFAEPLLSRNGQMRQAQCFTTSGHVSACFNIHLSEAVLGRRIESAALFFNKLADPEDFQTGGNHTFILSEQEFRGDQWIETYSRSLEISGTGNKWIQVDVNDLVERWLQDPNVLTSERHMRVFCSTCGLQHRSPIGLQPQQRPFIEIKLAKKPTHPRHKRDTGSTSTLHCYPGLYSHCCLQQFFVNFTDIGWDSWILQPQGYYANYCTGSCRASTSERPYNHVISVAGEAEKERPRSQYQATNAKFGEIIPCCAPTKMSDLDLLYALKLGDIRKNTLKNMIVDACGC